MPTNADSKASSQESMTTIPRLLYKGMARLHSTPAPDASTLRVCSSGLDQAETIWLTPEEVWRSIVFVCFGLQRSWRELPLNESNFCSHATFALCYDSVLNPRPIFVKRTWAKVWFPKSSKVIGASWWTLWLRSLQRGSCSVEPVHRPGGQTWLRLFKAWRLMQTDAVSLSVSLPSGGTLWARSSALSPGDLHNLLLRDNVPPGIWGLHLHEKSELHQNN